MTIVLATASQAWTAQKMILRAYQMIGYYGANETMNAADAQLGLDILNKMLDSWSNESLACYAILEQSFQLQVGVDSYTIGLQPNAVIYQQRPIRVMEGSGAAYLQDFNQNNYRVDVVTREQWNQIANRGPTTVSDIPDTLFYDPQMPLGVVNLWPSPTIGYTLFFDSFQQFTDMGNLYQTFNLPPGYELAILSNLAVLLGPFCKNASVSPDVKAIAKSSKMTVKRSNIRNNVAQFDKEITKSGQPNFNIYSGRYQ
jgi:hypothetical protein